MRTQSETSAKIDVLALAKEEYVAPKKPVILDIKPATFLSISGKGSPGCELFGIQVGAIYGLAFTIKMTRKFCGLGDYTVGKLEARWSMTSEEGNSCGWQWEIVIRTPDFVSVADLKNAADKLIEKGHPKEVREVKVVSIAEGQCVQMLHVGPYEQESVTFAAMIAYAKSHGLSPAGPHHEIYLSDPRRVPPDKLRTILRLPVAKQ